MLTRNGRKYDSRNVHCRIVRIRRRHDGWEILQGGEMKHIYILSMLLAGGLSALTGDNSKSLLFNGLGFFFWGVEIFLGDKR